MKWGRRFKQRLKDILRPPAPPASKPTATTLNRQPPVIVYESGHRYEVIAISILVPASMGLDDEYRTFMGARMHLAEVQNYAAQRADIAARQTIARRMLPLRVAEGART